jgi:hypothetical protein
VIALPERVIGIGRNGRSAWPESAHYPHRRDRHHAEVLAAASWALALVWEYPPDVVFVERTAAGVEVLFDAPDGIEVHIAVLVTRFSDVPPAYRRIDPEVLGAIVRRAEAAAAQRS